MWMMGSIGFSAPLILLALIGIAVLYIITTEIAKHFFFRVKQEKRVALNPPKTDAAGAIG